MHLFVDEARRGCYLLVAGRLAPAELGRTRALLRGLRLPGQRRLHLQVERDSRRKLVIARLVEAELRTLVYAGRGRPEKVRQRCLSQLVDDAYKAGDDRIVLESRGRDLDRADRLTIWRKLQELGTDAQSAPTYEHLEPHEDPALWLADAVAWAYGAGGDWKRRVSPLLENVVDLGRL